MTFNATGGQYFYDGDGHRVKKVAGSVTTVFVYNAMGQLTTEYTNTNDTTPPVGGGGTSYLTSDHLGSTRVVTKSDGTVKARYDYLPFGEELGSGIGGRTTGMGYGAADSTEQKFTQKERDTESGLDYFGARYCSGAQGRFTSVDVISMTPARAGDPQQINLYCYARNNPLVYIDPTGLTIDISRLSAKDKEQYDQIVILATEMDDKGNYLNPLLHQEWEQLETDSRTFVIENKAFGAKSAIIGEFNITKFKGNDDFTEAVIQLDLNRIKNLEPPAKADLIANFNRFEGLLGKDKTSLVATEVFGHEGAHAVFALANVPEAVKQQQLLNERDAARNALPKTAKYPYPPDLMAKMEAAAKALIPTERYAQTAEKIINGELRASHGDKRRKP